MCFVRSEAECETKLLSGGTGGKDRNCYSVTTNERHYIPHPTFNSRSLTYSGCFLSSGCFYQTEDIRRCSCSQFRELEVFPEETVHFGHRKVLRRRSPFSQSSVMFWHRNCIRTWDFDSKAYKNSAGHAHFGRIKPDRLPNRTELFSLAFAKSLLMDLCVNGVLLLLTVINHLCYSLLCIFGPLFMRWCQLILVHYVVLCFLLIPASDACSTRPSPKPRPPRPFWRVDETLPKFNCSPDYEALYCLNNGSCFMQMNMHDKPTPYCVCYGYYGRRCEYLDVPDRHLPSMQRQRIETAAISVAVTLLIMIAFILSVAIYVYRRRMKYPRTVYDATDGICDRPFSIQRKDRYALRRPRQLEVMESGVVGFNPSSAGALEFIDSDRKVTGTEESKSPQGGALTNTQRAEIHIAPRASVV